MKKENIKNWLEGKKKGFEDVYEFFRYYVIFNSLYNEKYSGKNSEATAIKKFIKDIEKNNKFDLKISLSENMEIFKEKVKNMQAPHHSMFSQEKLRKGKYEELFVAIYQIRCNLFHGSKEMDCLRDDNLVKEATDILKQFLEKYLEIK